MKFTRRLTRSCLVAATLVLMLIPRGPLRAAPPVPEALRPWMEPQDWQRDTAGPVIALGEEGEFDHKHLLAPCVARQGNAYWLWYMGAAESVSTRVYRLGLATSPDGRAFTKHPANPLLGFAEQSRSLLTPTLLRDPQGEVLRERGRLRMWFSSTDFVQGQRRHTLHESFSRDGLAWTPPSEPLLEGVYAPTILKEGDGYQMWFTDVSHEPWVIRHATSGDGRRWEVTEKPVLTIDQAWEQQRLFYPTVLKADGVYLMWYGSYWSAHASKTAIGFAASTDGLHFHKHPQNPVLRPDPSRPWESHYTTSASVLRLSDGSWRIWYASRTRPPFHHKYFAIGTARWSPASPAANE